MESTSRSSPVVSDRYRARPAADVDRGRIPRRSIGSQRCSPRAVAGRRHSGPATNRRRSERCPSRSADGRRGPGGEGAGPRAARGSPCARQTGGRSIVRSRRPARASRRPWPASSGRRGRRRSRPSISSRAWGSRSSRPPDHQALPPCAPREAVVQQEIHQRRELRRRLRRSPSRPRTRVEVEGWTAADRARRRRSRSRSRPTGRGRRCSASGDRRHARRAPDRGTTIGTCPHRRASAIVPGPP